MKYYSDNVDDGNDDDDGGGCEYTIGFCVLNQHWNKNIRESMKVKTSKIPVSKCHFPSKLSQPFVEKHCLNLNIDDIKCQKQAKNSANISYSG